ncbi:MAG: hydantoinase/oxoprolinase family protein [Pseudomonadota bacterium]
MGTQTIRIGIDVGGTFTDFVLRESNRPARFLKVPSTPDDPARGIVGGLEALLRREMLSPDSVMFVGHGTTVATNMIIERRGARVALITTRGFGDVLELGRQARPNLYDYRIRRPAPLVPSRLRFEISERLAADGAILIPLAEHELEPIVASLKAREVEAVAVCLLHAYRNDAHESRIARGLAEALPDLFVTTSADVNPEFREYERCSTTVLNAYVGPKMRGYLDRLTQGVSDLGIRTSSYTINSNGGLMSAATVSRQPIRTCLSGPAAGVVGAARLAEAAGFRDLITLDIGGTSTDVALIVGGAPAFTPLRHVAGHPVRTPMVDINVIGAGGGSIARVDRAGGLTVGPDSAGADPGPMAYGRGGREPTVTDAHLVLGRLNPTALLGGDFAIDLEAARAGIAQQIGQPLTLDDAAAAHGIIRILAANIARAVRAIATKRGHELERFTLMAFGGAGPLLAAEVAKVAGLARIFVPVSPGTLCANAMLVSDVSMDFSRSVLSTLDKESWPCIRDSMTAMDGDARSWLATEQIPPERHRLERLVEARYRGQNFELPVPVGDSDLDLPAIRGRFEQVHRREYGYVIKDGAIEIVTLRTRAVGMIETSATLPVRATEGTPQGVQERDMFVDGEQGWRTVPVYDRTTLAAKQRIAGPAIIEEMSSTTVLLPGQTGSVDELANLVIET